MSVSPDQITLLRQFVELCKANVSILHMPQLKFYKDWIESLGGKIPQPQEKGHQHESASKNDSGASFESGDAKSTPSDQETPMDEETTPEPDQQKDEEPDSPEESDIELDNEGVIEGDNDPPLDMGDATLEVTEEMIDESSQKRQEAMDAVGEGRLEDAVNLYTKAILLNPQSAALFAKRASVLIRLQKPNAVIVDCNHAIQLNPDSAPAYKWRGKAHRLLGDWLAAYHDLNTSSRMDYDESIIELLHEVEGNAKKIMEHNRRYERERTEKDIRMRKKRAQEARERYERQKRESESKDSEMPSGFPGGMPGGFPGGFPGGMPSGAPGGAPGGMPDISALFSDPELMAAFQDPEVLKAFQDVSQNPANISKYESNPKIKSLIEKMSSKFGKKPGPSGGGASTP